MMVEYTKSLVMALPSAELCAHTAQSLSHRPVSASIPNAALMSKT
ncbi:hypothetical protein [Mucilaginibacter boryungensis]|nr:hypothetical protein [Mucilaginibacter boryungensis]